MHYIKFLTASFIIAAYILGRVILKRWNRFVAPTAEELTKMLHARYGLPTVATPFTMAVQKREEKPQLKAA